MKNHNCPTRLFIGVGILLIAGCGSATIDTQLGDIEYMPVVAAPAYAPDQGPIVLVDAAHGNFHTIDGRYGAFARLLEADGCVVRSADDPATRNLLEQADVYVISNAIKGGEEAEWVLPAVSAFTETEIDIIRGWVEDGGALLLIADHMPMPGATADLAAAFGFVFYNGFAFRKGTGGGGLFTMSRADGTLADHLITRGRNSSERIELVMTFTGQAFRPPDDAAPLFIVPPGVEILLPSVAWEFSERTPRVSADGLLQGAALRVGRGRVAVFGEAAMFTAQRGVENGEVSLFGMNHPEARDNEQFILNVIHWLTGLLDPDQQFARR